MVRYHRPNRTHQKDKIKLDGNKKISVNICVLTKRSACSNHGYPEGLTH